MSSDVPRSGTALQVRLGVVCAVLACAFAIFGASHHLGVRGAIGFVGTVIFTTAAGLLIKAWRGGQ
jgi:hypothetical protein